MEVLPNAMFAAPNGTHESKPIKINVQIEVGLGKSPREDFVEPSGSSPGEESVKPCLSEAWQDFLHKESPRCFEDGIRAGGAERKNGPLCEFKRYFPEPDRPTTCSAAGRFWSRCPGLKPCPVSSFLEGNHLLAELGSWNGSSSAPLELPFDLLSGQFPEQAQAWETDYLSPVWPRDAEDITPNPAAHWFELELNPGGVHPNADKAKSVWYTDEIDSSLKIESLGRLFGTRVPRQLGSSWQAPDSYKQESSDGVSFKAHMDLIDRQRGSDPNPANWLVVPLIIDKTLEADGGGLGFGGHDEVHLPDAQSEALWEYYKQLGITTLQCPYNDFSIPDRGAATECIERITIHLAKGGNVVIHCFGGTGRTATMLMAVAKTLGVPDVIAWGTRVGGPGKSKWLEIHEQQLFIDQLPRVMTKYMMASLSGEVKELLDSRFERQLAMPPKWKDSVTVAVCQDERKIAMQDRCIHYRTCRTCWGQPAPVNEIIPLKEGEPFYDYVAADVPIFRPRCRLPNGDSC